MEYYGYEILWVFEIFKDGENMRDIRYIIDIRDIEKLVILFD